MTYDFEVIDVAWHHNRGDFIAAFISCICARNGASVLKRRSMLARAVLCGLKVLIFPLQTHHNTYANLSLCEFDIHQL